MSEIFCIPFDHQNVNRIHVLGIADQSPEPIRTALGRDSGKPDDFTIGTVSGSKLSAENLHFVVIVCA